jgi:hypothetical protein
MSRMREMASRMREMTSRTEATMPRTETTTRRVAEATGEGRREHCAQEEGRLSGLDHTLPTNTVYARLT